VIRRFVSLLVFHATISCGAELKTASSHSMQYYLSLPNGWAAGKQWPVVMVIEDANRQFEATAARFAAARGDMPFILATPLVVTNGGPRYRQAPDYKYSEAVWNEIERDTCRFDFDGIRAVASDLHRQYGGEEKFFLTGFEAGGHTVWAYLFRYPETLRGVAPVETNFAGRCVASDSAATATNGTSPTIRVFGGAAGRSAGPCRVRPIGRWSWHGSADSATSRRRMFRARATSLFRKRYSHIFFRFGTRGEGSGEVSACGRSPGFPSPHNVKLRFMQRRHDCSLLGQCGAVIRKGPPVASTHDRRAALFQGPVGNQLVSIPSRGRSVCASAWEFSNVRLGVRGQLESPRRQASGGLVNDHQAWVAMSDCLRAHRIECMPRGRDGSGRAIQFGMLDECCLRGGKGFVYFPSPSKVRPRWLGQQKDGG
jgi:dienelactone hydrolase